MARFLGRQMNKGTIVGITIGGVVVSGYIIYKYEKNKNATAAAAAQSQAAASSGYGYGYGTQGPYGYGTNAQFAYGYGASGGFFPSGYYGYGTPYPGGGTTPGIPATTNAQWAQAAETQLQQDGFQSRTVVSALGAYLAGRPVDPSQVNIVDAAIGVEGYPPQAGTNNHPPEINTGGTTGGGQGGKETVPSIVGKRSEQARDEVEHAGLKYQKIPANTPPGLPATVTSQTPAAGRKVNPGSTVTAHVQVTK